MKVCFLIDKWAPERGGAEKYLYNLAVYLYKHGYNIHIIAGKILKYSTNFTFKKIHPFGFTRHGYESSIAKQLLKKTAENKCSISIGIRHLPRVDILWLHGGTYKETLEAQSLAITNGRSNKSIKIRGRHKLFLDLEKEAIQFGGAKKIICVSKVSYNRLIDFYPEAKERTVVIPNGIDLNYFSIEKRIEARRNLLSILGINSSKIILGFSGKNPIRKGLPLVFESLKYLPKASWHLVAAGIKKPKKWIKLAKKKGIPLENITMFPHLDPLLISGGSDIFLLPTWGEPCALTILEALACGTPVITTKQTGASEVINQSVSGSILDIPLDPKILAHEIETWSTRILKKKIDRSLIRKCVLERDITKTLSRIENIIQKLYGKHI